MSVKDRARRALSLEEFDSFGAIYPEPVEKIILECPWDHQMVLRTLIQEPFGEITLHDNLQWTKPIIDAAVKNQKNMGINHPFIYLTVRHGLVNTEKDDEWHTDGFSMRISHLPEQNYVWVNSRPTQYVVKNFAFPKDFDPCRHNVHQFFADNISEDDQIQTAEPYTVYCLDPYVVHRRPKMPDNVMRTFVRVSFTPIPIMDKNNTTNIYLGNRYQEYDRDGVEEFRNKLEKYEVQKC
jgi:hypothetical protein